MPTPTIPPEIVEKLAEPLKEAKVDLQRQTITLTWRGLWAILLVAASVGGATKLVTSKQNYAAKATQDQIDEMKTTQKDMSTRIDRIYETLMSWEKK